MVKKISHRQTERHRNTHETD